MRTFRLFGFTAVLLLVMTQRAPAPIYEESSSTPVPRVSAHKPATQQSASTKPASGTEKFVGTWQGNASQRNDKVSFVFENIMTIQNRGKSASLELTQTGTPLTHWTDMPEGYTTSPIITKWRTDSNDLTLDGSNLRIRWAPWKLVDWSPKVFSSAQIDTLKNAANLRQMSVYTLRGNQLTREFDSQGGVVYNRIK